MSRADQPRARNAVEISQLSLLAWLKQSFPEQHRGRAEGESRARLESKVGNIMTKQCPSCSGYLLSLAAWRCGNESEACSDLAQCFWVGKQRCSSRMNLMRKFRGACRG